MSHSAMPLGDWLSVSRKGGTVEVGWCIHAKGENSVAMSGFGCKNPSARSFLLL